MPRRLTIGSDPFEVLTSPAPTPPATGARGTTGTLRTLRTKGATGARKMRLTVHVPPELVDRARNAVVALSGPPHRLTLADLAERALRREVDRLEREHADGRAFPTRDAELRGGRPVGR